MERNAFAYLDDIIIISRTVEEHVQHLQEIFRRLRRANLRLNAKNCSFFERSLVYLGYVISEEDTSSHGSRQDFGSTATESAHHMQGVEEMSRDHVMVQEICTQLCQRSAAHVFATQERKEMPLEVLQMIQEEKPGCTWYQRMLKLVQDRPEDYPDYAYENQQPSAYRIPT
ncbi:uncharacterized protein LOC127010752 [Drosophila biarmipes]|uniref:uncharacterized protein LOC127010752 n=1 Tax=Drosophila biarmipes TaxID=125945 RepID=UPI0021CC9ACA|nr:uncharacterized protein LOC127010752 [Drosophila biarmipes]